MIKMGLLSFPSALESAVCWRDLAFDVTTDGWCNRPQALISTDCLPLDKK